MRSAIASLVFTFVIIQSVLSNSLQEMLVCSNGGNWTTGDAECSCPLTKAGPSCATTPTCTTHDVNATLAENFPYVNAADSTYTSNTLHSAMRNPWVARRHFTSIAVVGATDAKCTFGTTGSLWTFSFDDTNCEGIYTLNLPWSAHSTCGFTLDASNTDPTLSVYKARVETAYTESIPDLYLDRTINFGYIITVSFPKSIEVTSSSLSINSSLNMNAALTKNTYDSATGKLSLEITTLIDYPNKVIGPLSLTIPTQAAVSDAIAISDVTCPDTLNAPCRQKISFTEVLPDPSVCNFNGVYTIGANVITCRSSSDCSNTSVVITFEILGGDVCGKVGVNALISGSLATTASDFSTAKSNFKLGERAYFKATLTSADGNTATLVFRNITFNDGNGEQTLYLEGTPQTIAGSTRADLQLNNAAQTFSVYLTSNVFKVNAYGSITYTFKAACVLTFAGNKKRVVMASINNGNLLSLGSNIDLASGEEIATSQPTVAPTQASITPTSEPVSNDKQPTKSSPITSTTLIAVVCAFGGISLIVVVVIVVLIRRNKKSQQQRV